MRECGVINCVHKYRFIFDFVSMFVSQLHLVQKSSDTIKLLSSSALRFLVLTETQIFSSH